MLYNRVEDQRTYTCQNPTKSVTPLLWNNDLEKHLHEKKMLCNTRELGFGEEFLSS